MMLMFLVAPAYVFWGGDAWAESADGVCYRCNLWP